MPLDMRILESRDPDGRLAEAIKHGRKVNSSDYEALVTHSKKYLQARDDEAGVGADFEYIKPQKKHSVGTPKMMVKKSQTERPPRPATITETRQQELDAKAAKRRAKRQKRK